MLGQIGGPTGAFIVIVYNIIANFGLEGLAVGPPSWPDSYSWPLVYSVWAQSLSLSLILIVVRFHRRYRPHHILHPDQ